MVKAHSIRLFWALRLCDWYVRLASAGMVVYCSYVQPFFSKQLVLRASFVSATNV